MEQFLPVRESLTLSKTWYQTSILQNYERITVCCLKPHGNPRKLTRSPNIAAGRQSEFPVSMRLSAKVILVAVRKTGGSVYI